MFEDLDWGDEDASHFSAWLQAMLVTNPKARATAAQSALHPFLEPMDEEVEEEEILGTSSSSETEREASCGEFAQDGGVLGGKVEDLEERLMKVEAHCAGEVSRLEAKLEKNLEAKDAESNPISKITLEVSDLKAQRETDKSVADNLKQILGDLEGKFEKLEAGKRLESEQARRLEDQVVQMQAVIEAQNLAIEELKQKYIIHFDSKDVLVKEEEAECVKPASEVEERSEEVQIDANQEKVDKTYFSYKKPLSNPAVVVPSPSLPQSVSVNFKKNLRARENERQKNDSENNAKAGKVAEEAKIVVQEKVHPVKKSLVELMQKRLKKEKDLTRIELKTVSRTFDKKEKTGGEESLTQLVISNIKLPCSIISQTKLLHLVKKTGTLVKYRFSESGSSCWLQLACEVQASETLVALDGLLWEGGRLSVKQASVAALDEESGVVDEPSRSQYLEKRRDLKEEPKGEVASKVRWGTLRMDEEDEERRKRRKRAREEQHSREEERWKRSRKAWGL